MPSYMDYRGIDRILAKLNRIKDLDPTPVLRDWGKVIIEDNRAGVLGGKQYNDSPMAPVKYRPAEAKPTAFRSHKAGKFGTTTGRFKGFAPAGQESNAKVGRTVLPNNNLTTEQYKKLSGPPLAPRGDESRVIANLVLREPYKTGDRWVAEAYWADVVDAKGRPFLKRAFAARRDLRGVREAGRKKAAAILRLFAKHVLRNA
jgi:hypothetical protein